MVTRCSNNFGPVPVPREGHPAVHHQPARRQEGAAVRRRRQHPRLDPRRTITTPRPTSCCASGTVGEIYNIGAGNEITNRELTHRLLELTGRDESFIKPVADRLGHDRRYSITHDKVTALGWKTEHNLDDGLAATVEWYRDNRAWWEPLKARAGF